MSNIITYLPLLILSLFLATSVSIEVDDNNEQRGSRGNRDGKLCKY